MTRDEIEKLSPQQLNVEIAKTKGWKWYEWAGRITGEIYAVLTNGGAIAPFGECDQVETPTAQEKNQSVDCRMWVSNIAAAWELVEEMRADGQIFELTARSTKNVAIARNSGFYLNDQWNAHLVMDVSFAADTAPLAICRAYLMWKQEVE